VSENTEEAVFPQSQVVWYCKHSAKMAVDRVERELMGAAKEAFADGRDAEAKNYRQAASWVKSCCGISIPAEIEKLQLQWLTEEAEKAKAVLKPATE